MGLESTSTFEDRSPAISSQEQSAARLLDDANDSRALKRACNTCSTPGAPNLESPLRQPVPATQPGSDLYQYYPHDGQPARPGDRHAGNGDWRQNRDGSYVEFGPAADGRVHPLRIIYTDGSSTQYGYGQDGRAMEVVDFDRNGTKLHHWIARDGFNFRDINTGMMLSGNLEVRQDGTTIMTDRRGNVIESRTDGSRFMYWSDHEGRPHTLVLRGDGSAVEYMRLPDGSNRPIKVKFPLGNERTYQYDHNGNIYQVDEWGLGGQSGGSLWLSWRTQDGRTWIEQTGKMPALSGRLNLRSDGTHVFYFDNGYVYTQQPNGSLGLYDRDGRLMSGSTAGQTGNTPTPDGTYRR